MMTTTMRVSSVTCERDAEQPDAAILRVCDLRLRLRRYICDQLGHPELTDTFYPEQVARGVL